MSTLLNYNDRLWKPYKSFEYTGEPQAFTLEPGTYLLECNGARPEGNILSDTRMQFGGKALGILTLDEERTFYAYVGGNGHPPATVTERGKGGWNGGGDGAPAKYNVITQDYAWGCGGGGASDIRLSLPTTASSSYTLPEEYDELEYVMSDGQTGHFIDTGYKHSDKTKIEMVYEASGEIPPGSSSRGGTTKSEALFGARGLATTVNVVNSFGAYIYFNASNSYYNVIGKSTSSSGSTVEPVFNEKILVKMDIDNCSWTNFETGELIRNNSFGYNGQLTKSESNMYIFDINSGNSTYADSPSYVKMYSFKIYENGRMIHCYIPAQSKSDPTSKGIYDVIGETFIPFEYGTYGDVLSEKSTIIDEYEDIHTSEVEFKVPDEYTEHEWLHMSDDATPVCIPINYMVSPGSKIQFDIDTEPDSWMGWSTALIGSEADWRLKEFTLYFGADSSHVWYVTNATQHDVGEYASGHFIYELENGVGFKKYNPDGTLVTSTAVTEIANPVHPISIWGITTDTTRKSNPSNRKGKIYSFTAWDKINGAHELVRKLVPVSLKSDPTIYGMYDIMQRIFYRYDNVGTQYSEPLGPEVEEVTVVTKSITYTDSLMSRIIVAGGAGGKARGDGSANAIGIYITTGNGGGKVGGPPHQTSRWFGKVANQFEGGEFGTGITPESLKYTGAVQSYSAEGAAGGGGGWFGGYVITHNSSNMDEMGLSTNGGGGSGHINEDDHILDIYSQLNPDLLNFKLTGGMLVTRGATDPSIIIYKETQRIEARDSITFEFEARPEKLMLPPGVYDIDCYGGDGSFRYLPIYSGRGGYAHGRLTNLSTKLLYARVAGNGFHGSIYQLENFDSIGWNGAKHWENGDIRYSAGGGASDVRLYEDTLYHRILVAGGAGGAGKQQSIGGGGGGTTGGDGEWGYGERPGPGTQTSSPTTSTTSICGSFGFGGRGEFYGGGYGGAGGAGWYGGSGVYPDGSADDDGAGAGGSGYVLSESSYKPTGYMITDSEDYLTNGTMTTGGNILPRGFSRIIINCRQRFNSVKILCSDTGMSEFYKYNSTLNAWETFESEGTDTPTDAEFEEYGVDDIYTDEGLPSQYKILFEVPPSFEHDQIPNLVEINVMPNKQYISCNIKRDIDVTKIMKYKYIDTSRNPVEEGGEQPWDKTTTFDAAINIDHVAPDVENPLNAYDYNIDVRHLIDPITSESYIRINSYVDRIDTDTIQSFKLFKIVIG